MLPDHVEHGRVTPHTLWPLVSDLGLSIQGMPPRRSTFEADRDAVNTLSHDVARYGILLAGEGFAARRRRPDRLRRNPTPS